MAKKELVKVWDGAQIVEDNILFLKKTTKEVSFPLTEESEEVIKDLIDTYKVTPCAGIAANQIGYDVSIFVGMREDFDEDESYEDTQKSRAKNKKTNDQADNMEIYINPQIDLVDEKSVQVGSEGCLSIPEVELIVQRYDKIKVRYYNQNGEAIKKPLSKFLSRLFQHELDHLKGLLMVESDKIHDIIINKISKKKAELYISLHDKIKAYNSIK